MSGFACSGWHRGGGQEPQKSGADEYLTPTGGVEEIWCALSVRGTDDVFVAQDLRDLLFVTLERHVSPALFETRSDWPTDAVEWFEVVCLGVR